MLLSSRLYETLDRCPRRLAYERSWEPVGISPLGLLYAGVESSLCAGDPSQAAKDAVTELSAHRDVEAGDLSPLPAIRHVGFLAETVALALRRRLGALHRLENVRFGQSNQIHYWKSNLFETAGGDAHRIVFVSHLDDDTLRTFAHSWGTIGEMAVLEREMFLTFVVIGAQRGGRRYSHWTRAVRHPIQKSSLRFAPRRAKKNDGFNSGWVEVWREMSEIPAGAWLDQMERDDVMPEVLHTRRVNYDGNDLRMKQCRKEMLQLVREINSASEESPMRRTSCDDVVRGACPFQMACWNTNLVSIDQLGYLFRRRTE